MPAPDSICDLVQRFQRGLHKGLAAAGSPQEKGMLQPRSPSPTVRSTPWSTSYTA